MPSETGGMRNRSGGMSVSLASPDGRVVGGGVAGLLVAASPVQVLVCLNLVVLFTRKWYLGRFSSTNLSKLPIIQ